MKWPPPTPMSPHRLTRYAIVAKHGRPLFVTVPMDQHLVKESVVLALGVRLFAERAVSLAKATKLARLSAEDFISQPAPIGNTAVHSPRGNSARNRPDPKRTVRNAAARGYSQFSVLKAGIRNVVSG
jgi:hypothetical protein